MLFQTGFSIRLVYTDKTVREVLLEFLAMRQATRLLRIDFPRGGPASDTLLVINRLHAVESMSRDFIYTLELLSDRPDLPLRQLLGVMVTVSLIREDGTVRYFNGYVFAFQFVRNDSGFCYYEMRLRPWLAFLRHRRNCRLFDNLDIVSQTEKIFAHYPPASATSRRYFEQGEMMPIIKNPIWATIWQSAD